jgi:hypothetical protein
MTRRNFLTQIAALMLAAGGGSVYASATATVVTLYSDPT